MSFLFPTRLVGEIPLCYTRALKYLLALSLLLRLAFLMLAGLNAPLVGDELAYQQIAVNVASGHGFVQNNNPFFPGQILFAWQAPLYPLSLAALYFVFGPHPIIAKLFGILIGVATVYLTFDLARRLYPPLPPLVTGGTESPPRSKGGWRRVPWLAALFVAVYPGFLTSAHLLLSETLFTFLLVLAFDLMVAAVAQRGRHPPLNERERSFIRPLAQGEKAHLPPLNKGGLGASVLVAGAGAVWGAATLTRGITLYFALPLILWLAVASTPWRRVDWRSFLSSFRPLPFTFRPRPAIIFAIGLIAVIAPWTIRNLTVFHQLVLLETKGGVNFWLGNSPFTPNDFIRNVWKTGVREPILAALPADEVARDRTGYNLGESFVARDPWTFITRMPIKFADFWGFERNLVDAAEATRDGKAGGWSSPSKLAADLVSDVAYVILVLLAAGGFAFAGEDRWKALIGGFLLYFVLVHVVVFGDGRFHLPLIPLLAIYAAWFTANLGGPALKLRIYPIRGLAAFALGLIFIMVWVHEISAAWLELRGGL